MLTTTRRAFLGGAAATISGLAGLKASFGQPSPAARSAISIVDASIDTRPFIGLMERAGVQVVGRYLSRGCQIGKDNELARKRIAFNPPQTKEEACGNNVFLENGADKKPEHEYLLEKFALLSEYQFNNDTPAKFVFGLPDAHDLVESLVRSGTPRKLAGATAEAQLDAKAAIVQSGRIGQPDEAPIYFGVDFDLRSRGKVTDQHGNNAVDAEAALEGCLQYFKVLKGMVGDRLGCYGNGYINRILRQEGLVRFSWVSESRSFEETPKILRDGFLMKDGKTAEWHLFQHFMDKAWIDPHAALDNRRFELDGSVHNPTYDYFGAWKPGVLWRPDLERSKAILQDRWVAKRNAPVFETPSRTGKCVTRDDKPLYADYHRTVRTIGDSISANDETWLHVDLNEDGAPDGYCLKADFVGGIKKMPDFDGAQNRTMPQECPGG
jgi:hypothetical protein